MVIFDFLKKFGKSLGSRTLTLRVLVRGHLGFSQINLENHSVHPNFAVELFQQSFQGWD